MELNSVNEVAALQRLTVGQLRQRFAELFGEATLASNRTWLVKRIAWRMQWTMNSTLAEIGIHFPKLRRRAVAIGEKLGIYRDYPVSKGCTSPFAPIWINVLVSRQG